MDFLYTNMGYKVLSKGYKVLSECFFVTRYYCKESKSVYFVGSGDFFYTGRGFIETFFGLFVTWQHYKAMSFEYLTLSGSFFETFSVYKIQSPCYLIM